MELTNDEKKAILTEFKSRCINLSGWCRVWKFNVQYVYNLLYRPTKLEMTDKQKVVFEALKTDGIWRMK